MKTRKKKATLLLTALLILIIVYYSFDSAVFRALLPMAQTEAKTAATSLIEQSVFSAMPEGKSFTLVEKDKSSVKSISADTAALQSLRSDVTKAITRDMENLFLTLEIPLGSVVGGSVFSGRGIPLKVRIIAAGGLSVDTESEFCSAGLNQTCHRVYINATLELTLLYHGKTEAVTTETKILAAENVIVGEVPDAYFRTYQN